MKNQCFAPIVVLHTPAGAFPPTCPHLPSKAFRPHGSHPMPDSDPTQRPFRLSSKPYALASSPHSTKQNVKSMKATASTSSMNPCASWLKASMIADVLN